MNKDDFKPRDNKDNKDNSEIINKLYSNKDTSGNSKSKHSGITKLKGNKESEKYIKEMHDLADKNEFKNNVVVIGLGIIIAIIILFSIIMNTSFMKPKTDVVDSKTAPKNTTDKSSTKNTNINAPIIIPTKIYEYLNVKANRTSVLKKAVVLNHGSNDGLTVYLLSEILRTNGITIPTKTITVKQLARDLTSLGWVKNTNVSQLEKGDICFTTDMPGKIGSPSHTYVFMGWVKDGKTDYGNIIDGQVKEYNDILHKRNISITTTKKDKFSYFLRK